MTRIRRIDLRAEDGIAIAVAIILMAFMLMMGIAAASFVDGQSKLTANQRQRETAFNVAEAALNAQVTQISHHWAGTNGVGTPGVAFTPCPGGTFCPSSSELTGMVPSADTKVPITWQTNVYDNSGGLAAHFADSRVTNQCGCDANSDGKVWVRAEATVRNKRRVIVSLVQKQTQAESVPHAAIIAGALTISNNGNHSNYIVDANGGVVAVRCEVNPLSNGGESSSSPCLGQPLGVSPTQTATDWNALLNNQISNFSSAVQNYNPAPVFTQDQIDRFINTAKSESTYYTSCPSSLSGAVVVVDAAVNCVYNSSDVWNTAADPGFLIFLNAQSTVSIGPGGATYNGVVYMANMGSPPILGSPTQNSGTVLTVHGGALINGGVIVEGPGRVEAGSSGQLNIRFDDHGYDAVKSLAAAGIIQNSWREIRPGV